MDIYEKMLAEEYRDKKKKKKTVKIAYDFKTLTSCVSQNVHLSSKGLITGPDFKDLDNELLGN